MKITFEAECPEDYYMVYNYQKFLKAIESKALDEYNELLKDIHPTINKSKSNKKIGIGPKDNISRE